MSSLFRDVNTNHQAGKTLLSSDIAWQGKKDG